MQVTKVSKTVTSEPDEHTSRFVPVAGLIWQEATTRPDRDALVADCRQVSFGELICAADELAESFRRAGAQAGEIIGLCTQSALEMITGAMAAWKLRCAYLPLDPAAPADRLKYMITETKAALVAASSDALPSVPSGVWTRMAIGIDFNGCKAQHPRSVESYRIAPDDLAYVIYTSGSTGTPKGIAITQANLAYLIDWYASAFALTREDRATQMASLIFDASVLEIWTNLAQGVPLHILDRSLARSPEQLRNYFVEQQISISFVATPVAEQMIAMEWPASTKLRYLLTGADTLRAYPPPGLPFQLVNNYGPTECTVLATSGVVPARNGQTAAPSIGRAVKAAKVYILNSELQPVAEGEIGEVFIGGSGVGRGYIGSAELTTERFLSDPFQSGERIYRTGDRGRKLPSGEIEFCGRSDDQIKLRGFRIEPGEIVDALRAHAAVKNAYVSAFARGENKILAAFVVLDGEPSDSELRDHLATRLPEYMLPDQFVRMAALPLTSQGKVDRAALTVTEDLSSGYEEDMPFEQNEIQEEVFGIVSSILGVRKLGSHDNFFRLGGHSLLAAQLLTRVRKAFGIDLPIRAVFEAPTVASLSNTIELKLLETIDQSNAPLVAKSHVLQAVAKS